MSKPRLILVPQLPVKMRYQEWWIAEARKHLKPHFREIRVLGSTTPVSLEGADGFSVMRHATNNEILQMEEYLDLTLEEDDVLFHCDLSYPGLFHSVLAHKRPARCMVFCHASAKNRYDLFSKVRGPKWGMERGAAAFYDKVLVATWYHCAKLRLPNSYVLGALPYAPFHKNIPAVPYRESGFRDIEYASVARPCRQKVNLRVERALEEIEARPVVRKTFTRWADYVRFLCCVRYLVITSSEETYGYQVVDAVKCGATPIAPNDFSYPELLPSRLLYDNRQSPEDQAEEISRIAATNWHKPIGEILCDSKAIGFWDNLAAELTT